jgi:hypothetical protein
LVTVSEHLDAPSAHLRVDHFPGGIIDEFWSSLILTSYRCHRVPTLTPRQVQVRPQTTSPPRVAVVAKKHSAITSRKVLGVTD